MTGRAREWAAAVIAVAMAMAGMALVVFLFGWVIDPTPVPVSEYVPAPTCRPGAPAVGP